MQYLVTQWIVWLTVAALIGGCIGFLLRRGPSARTADHETVSASAGDETAGGTEPGTSQGLPPEAAEPPQADVPTEASPQTPQQTPQQTPPQARPILGIPRPQHEEVVAERDELRRLLDERDALIDRLYDAVDERDGRIEALTSAAQPLAAGPSSLDDDEVEEMRLALEEHEAALDALYEAVDERQAAITALRAAVDERDDAIDALYEAIDQRDRRIAELRRTETSDDPTR